MRTFVHEVGARGLEQQLRGAQEEVSGVGSTCVVQAEARALNNLNLNSRAYMPRDDPHVFSLAAPALFAAALVAACRLSSSQRELPSVTRGILEAARCRPGYRHWQFPLQAPVVVVLLRIYTSCNSSDLGYFLDQS